MFNSLKIHINKTFFTFQDLPIEFCIGLTSEHTMMMMKSVEFVSLLVILADILGCIIKGVVCRCLLLGINISQFSLLDYVVH